MKVDLARKDTYQARIGIAMSRREFMECVQHTVSMLLDQKRVDALKEWGGNELLLTSWSKLRACLLRGNTKSTSHRRRFPSSSFIPAYTSAFRRHAPWEHYGSDCKARIRYYALVDLDRRPCTEDYLYVQGDHGPYQSTLPQRCMFWQYHGNVRKHC